MQVEREKERKEAAKDSLNGSTSAYQFRSSGNGSTSNGHHQDFDPYAKSWHGSQYGSRYERDKAKPSQLCPFERDKKWQFYSRLQMSPTKNLNWFFREILF